MAIEDIYSELAAHMIKGMMFHEQLANYYDFLGLNGAKRCHEYHYLAESCGYRKLCRYFINHHNKLIPTREVEDPEVIPDSWYRYTRQDVDANTKKNAVKNGLSRWVEWERETKQLYEKAFNDLLELGEVASAMFIKCFIKDVDHELKVAERCEIEKSATGYDMNEIIMEQHSKHEKYKEKIKCVGNLLC